MKYGKRYTILFTTLVCGFFAILVTGSAVLLKDRQVENQKVDRMKNVLTVGGLIQPGQALSNSEVLDLFKKTIDTRLVDIKTGAFVTDGPDPADYDQREAQADNDRSDRAPENDAGIFRLPKFGLVHLVKGVDGRTGYSALLLPVEGKGLWSTLYGFLALETDLNTIRGITYYSHGETPGLGGEVDNPKWKAQFAGKRIFGEDGAVRFKVKKGDASDDPYAVNGISGATITSRGVTKMIEFWMGPDGYGPFIHEFRKNGAN